MRHCIRLLALFSLVGTSCQKRAFNAATSKQAAPSVLAGEGLDVNDVSVLFSFPRDKSEIKSGLLGAETKLADGTQIWPEALWEQVTKVVTTPTTQKVEGVVTFEGGRPVAAPAQDGPGIDLSTDEALGVGKFPGKTRTNWRVVSFRYDPCAPMVDPTGASCKVELRLILQPFRSSRDADREEDMVNAVDATAHLVFSYSREDGSRLAKRLLALKSPATSGQPLGVHPVMAKEGLKGPYATAMKAFLKEELSAKRLTAIAFMGLAPSPEPWVFLAGAVDGTGRFLPVAQDFGSRHSLSQKLLFGGTVVEPNFGTSRPNTSSLHVLPADPVSTHRLLTEEEIDVLAEIENPDRSALLVNEQNSTKHRDCVSCHTSTQRLLLMSAAPEGKSERKILRRFADSKVRYRTPSGVTGYPAKEVLPNSPWSVINFGYMSIALHGQPMGRPSISMRTVNESASVAEYTNRVVLGITGEGGKAGPSPLRCDDVKVTLCVNDLALSADCIKKHCSGGGATEETPELAGSPAPARRLERTLPRIAHVRGPAPDADRAGPWFSGNRARQRRGVQHRSDVGRQRTPSGAVPDRLRFFAGLLR